MVDKSAFLFQPDVLVIESFRRKPPLEPEKRLMLAILEDALACFQKYIFYQDGEEENLFRDAAEWILMENSNWHFSFENICDSLELNPEYLRKGLWLWREKTKKSHSVLPINRGKIGHMKIAS